MLIKFVIINLVFVILYALIGIGLESSGLIVKPALFAVYGSLFTLVHIVVLEYLDNKWKKENQL